MIDTDILKVADIIDYNFGIFKRECANPEGRSSDFDGHFLEAISSDLQTYLDLNNYDYETPDADFEEMALEVAQSYAKLETDLERDYCEGEFKAMLLNIYMHNVPRIMGHKLFWSKHHCREKYLKSLPVTKEILEANGFVYDKFNRDYSDQWTHIKFQDDGDVDVVDYDLEGSEYCFCTLKSALDFEKAMQLRNDNWTLKLPEGLKYQQTK